MRVPNPAAQSRIDALNAELDGLRARRGRARDVIRRIEDRIYELQDERSEIYRTCERVEIDR